MKQKKQFMYNALMDDDHNAFEDHNVYTIAYNFEEWVVLGVRLSACHDYIFSSKTAWSMTSDVSPSKWYIGKKTLVSTFLPIV